jgi:ribosomal RNA-processing protein 7
MNKYRSAKKSLDKPVGKTLQIHNIPPYATESAIKRIFSETVGEVDRVTLFDSHKNEHKSLYQVNSEFFKDKLPFKFLIGFVIFKKALSLDAVFRLDSLPPLSTKEEPVLTGVAKWMDEHNKANDIDIEAMQNEINLYMQHFDKVKSAETHQDEGDDDGWVTVGKKGNVQGFSQHETIISKLEQKVAAQKKKSKNMKNFYSFELREGKKRHLLELRRKFEDDRSKLNSMKQNRKFKPY